MKIAILNDKTNSNTIKLLGKTNKQKHSILTIKSDDIEAITYEMSFDRYVVVVDYNNKSSAKKIVKRLLNLNINPNSIYLIKDETVFDNSLNKYCFKKKINGRFGISLADI